MPFVEVWDADPLVKLQDKIFPVLTMATDLLSRLLMSEDGVTDIPNLDAKFAAIESAERLFRDGGSEFLNQIGVKLASSDLEPCLEAAETVALVRTSLQARFAMVTRSEPQTVSADLATLINVTLPAKVYAANNTFRRVLITAIIDRQRQLSQQAHVAIRQLSDISETIFFIGINASVEASRVGDQGRGFNVISEDIRRLASNARESTANLRAVLATEGASA